MSDLKFVLRPSGEELDWPSMSSLTLADAIIINLVTGMSLENFGDQRNEIRVAGLLAVALQRAHKDWPPQKVAEIVRAFTGDSFDVVGLEVADTTTPTQTETGEPTESTEPSDSASESGEPQG